MVLGWAGPGARLRPRPAAVSSEKLVFSLSDDELDDEREVRGMLMKKDEEGEAGD